MATSPSTYKFHNIFNKLKNIRGLFLCAILMVGFAGCTSSTEELSDNIAFASNKYQEVTSESGQLRIEIRTGPDQPPVRGEVAVQMVVYQVSDGSVMDGLQLDVIPWMPSMGHGTSAKPQVVSQGNGIYLLKNIQLYMAGQWELQVSISGKINDRVTCTLAVQLPHNGSAFGAVLFPVVRNIRCVCPGLLCRNRCGYTRSFAFAR
jgi:hypothetical protein